MPWTDKDDATDWTTYFHLRNRLITLALHNTYDVRRALVQDGLRTTFKHLMAMEYSTVALRHKSIEDFLAGRRACSPHCGGRSSGRPSHQGVPRGGVARSTSRHLPLLRSRRAAERRWITLGLVLDYADRRGADILTGTDLAPILNRAGVSLAVLSACHSGGGLAQELVHIGIPIVVAMQHQIEATHAVEFNKSFYAALFSGATVDEAVSCGRIRLHELGAHYGRPVLYHRSDIGAFLGPITGRKP